MTLSGYVKDHERRARKEGLEEGKKEGLQEGLAEGIKAGEKEASRRIAAKLKATGMSCVEIAEMTGLNEEEIEEL